MSEISRSALFGKLNSLAYKAIEGATVFCKLRGNPYVELVHWIQQILQTPDSDLHRIVRHFELDPSRLAKDVTEALDRLPRGASSISDLSAHVENAVERGWVYATLMFGEPRVRTGHLVVGMLKTPSLRNALIGISRQFEHIKADTLTEDFARIVNGSPEDRLGATDGSSLAAPGEASDAMAPAQMGKQEALKRFATNLTERARKGEIDPVSGRDEEIRQIVDILMRRRQNNPILTGEAGVGKTAVVEGFALRLARGDVPPPLQNVSLYTLDIGLLQAGASMKGEFENRLAAGDRRSAGVAQADHPVRGRGAYADRRGRRGGHGRRREPAQAGAGARHVAHDRRDDVGRIQEVHREGPRAHPALPGGEGRGAERGQGDPDGPRRRVRCSRSITGFRCSTRRSRRRCGCRIATFRGGSCPTRRSACSIPPARAWPSASTACRRSSRTAGGRSRPCRPRWRSSAARKPSASTPTSAERPRKRSSRRASSAARSLEERWNAERELVERVLAIRAKLRKGSEPVEGTGSKLEQAAEAQKTRRRRAGRRSNGDAGRTTGTARRARRAPGEAVGAAGRVAADPAERRRAGGRIGRAGLDRRAGRPHGEERDRDGVEPGGGAQPAGDRPASRRST